MRISKKLNKCMIPVLLVGVMIFTACGSKEVSNSENSDNDKLKTTEVTKKEPEVKKENISIKLVYKYNEDWEKWFGDLEKEYEGLHENVDINPLPIKSSEGDFFAKMALMMQTEDAVDILTEDTFMINSDAAAGYLMPIEGIENWSEWDHFYDNVKEGVKDSKGTLYGIPYNTDTRGLFYNSEILKQAGVEMPWQPESWDDILEVCRKVKVSTTDVIPIWFNTGKATGEATTMQTFEMLLYGTEDRLYEDNKWVVNSQGFLDSLNFINTVYREDLGPKLSKVLNTQGKNYARNELIPNGQLAILLEGNWVPKNWRAGAAGEWAEAVDVMKIAPMPTQNGQTPGHVSMSGGWGLAINSECKNKEEALDFIKFATTKDSLVNYSRHGGSLAPRKDVVEDEVYKKDVFRTEATKFLEFTHYRPASEAYPSISTEIQTAVEAVAIGELTPEEAMEAYAKNVKRIVGEENITTK